MSRLDIRTDGPRVLAGGHPPRVAVEVQRMLTFLTELLGPVGPTRIIDRVDPGALAHSYPGLITVHPGLLDYPGTLLTQFLPHELAHQWFGSRVRSAGPGYLWVRECLPEYLQTRYLARRLPAGAYARVIGRYEGGPDLVAELLDLTESAVDTLSLSHYHRLLAAGTGLWLRTEQRLGRDRLDRVLRRLATATDPVDASALLSTVDSTGPLSTVDGAGR